MKDFKYVNRADLFNHPDFCQLTADSSGNPCVFRNHYECECGESWDDEWSCCCDDECAACGCDCSPDSDWIGPDEIELQVLWQHLPEQAALSEMTSVAIPDLSERCKVA